jgi:protein-L-isoaspartate(D-aspartate) O-methyltransferase
MGNKYENLINKLISEGYLFDQNLINAFLETPRGNYLPKLYKTMESINAPLPLKNSQTTSQPLTIAFMLELLSLEQGHKVLEIGYGAGWQTALISKIICPDPINMPNNQNNQCGEIFAYEITDEVAQLGESNIKKNLPPERIAKIHLHQDDYIDSYEEYTPFHRIISGAAFAQKPNHLISSLSPGGIIVYPTALNDIRRIIRQEDNTYVEETFPGFTFVPILHKDSS